MAYAGPDAQPFVSIAGESVRWQKIKTRIALPGVGESPFLAFSPEGKRLLVSSGIDIQLYDLASFKEIVPWDGHRSTVDFVKFSLDGKKILTGSSHGTFPNQEVATWDVATWKRLQLSSTRSPLRPGIGYLSPDHMVYFGNKGEDHRRLFDMTTGKLLGAFDDHDTFGSGRGVFSPSNRSFLVPPFEGAWGNRSMNARLYQVPTFKLQCELPFSPDRETPLTFSADDQLLAMFNWKDGLVHVFESATGKLRQRLGQNQANGQENQFPTSDPVSLALSPDGKLLAFWKRPSQCIFVWEISTGKEYLRLPFDDDQRWNLRMTLAWSADSRMLAVGDRKIELWEIASGRIRRELTGHDGYIRALAFSQDGLFLASGSTDTTALIWDLWSR